MPSKNVLKIDIPESYYHVYARGGGKRDIFLDNNDKQKFLFYLKRYLSKQITYNTTNQPYPNYYNRVELIAFCLMNNHFHMFLFQNDQGDMSHLMRSLMTSYSRYFNKKYNTSGPLFESRYKASIVTTEVYYAHITRYIHLNPKDWQNYEFSSLPYYIKGYTAEWLRPDKVLSMFDGPQDYATFVADYKENKKMIDEIKHELAN